MHVLNSAHIIAAFICGLAVLVVGIGVASLIELIIVRRQHRARIFKTTEYQSSPYAREHDHE